ncbi:transcriptional protein SWT1 [Aulostomus maculatus]
MSEKSKKKRRRKLSSSSEELDYKKSKEHHVTKKGENVKGRKESRLTKHQDGATLAVNEDSQRTRQVKKAVYRQSKTHATDQKPVNEDKDYSKQKSASLSSHRGYYSTKANPETSWKNTFVHVSKAKERTRSKSPSIIRAGREKKVSTGHSDKRDFHRSPSKEKKPLMSPSLVSSEQKKQRHNVMKKFKTEEPSRTENVSNSIKTKEPSKTSAMSRDSTEQKKMEIYKKMRQRLQAKNLKERKSHYKETQTSSTSTKPTTSEDVSDVLKNTSSVSGSKVSFKISKSSGTQHQKSSLPSPLNLDFKIPKKATPVLPETVEIKDPIPTNRTLKHETAFSDPGSLADNSNQTPSCVGVAPTFPYERKDESPSVSSKDPAVCDTAAVSWCEQMQVAEELHLARSEKRLDVNVMQSYGELTCMEIDSPEDGATGTTNKQLPHQDLILVLDTNILLSHLDYVKKMRSHGLGDALGFPIVLIPWVVLQELDSLKKGKGLSGSVAHLACPAISYIYNSLKSREPYLWGQSMQQAAEINNGLNAENNDDKVLQCCLQYQSLYPGCALILCTNDKNLCSKAVLSGVKALSKIDLEEEIGCSSSGLLLQNIPSLPHISPQISSPVPRKNCTPVPPHRRERAGVSLGPTQKDNKGPSEGEDEEKISCAYVSGLESCLQEVLSEVLEVEMKAVYDNLWLEIVYIKPPWTLQDVLQCLKKHWISVFGFIVPRNKLQIVLNLISFFSSGNSGNRSATLAVLKEAKDLLEAFGKRSIHVPGALAVMDDMVQQLKPQVSVQESSVCDVVMNDDEEDKHPTSTQVSHHEVWTMFENVWSNVCQVSLEVFKALGFDPHTMQRASPVGGPPPPQGAVAFLNKLSFMVSQLLQAFSSVLSSASGLEEVQTLLTFIQSNEIVDVDSRLTPTDLLDCFSQQEYRERLRVGGSQLMDLKEALDRCKAESHI